MKYLHLLLVFLIVSCGGGGGGGGSAPPQIAFALTLASGIFSTNEDTDLNGSIAASANESVTLTYAITSNVSSGVLTLSAGGSIKYVPNSNFFGTDQFQYSVNVPEKMITRTGTATITVNSVDDAPVLAFETVNDFSKSKMLFEDNQTFRLTVSDVDTSLDTLTFDALIGDQSIDAVFTLDTDDNTNGSGTLSLDLSSLQKAGLYTAQLRASDSASSGIVSFEAWFVSNKTTITIQQDDDPEDGFGSDGGTKTPKDYIVYYLSGNPSSLKN